jgi:hypothetical protein
VQPSLAQQLREPFHFLRGSDDELDQVLPQWRRLLPQPYPIYLQDESSTLLSGFPVLSSDGFAAVRDALTAYLQAEEATQVAALKREPFLRTDYAIAWRRYYELLVRVHENCLVGSYGRNDLPLFWLAHSLDIARSMREIPRRITRDDLRFGQKHGDEIKYRVYEKLQDRLKSDLLARMSQLGAEADDRAAETGRNLLRVLLGNLLIFTEEQIGSDLVELTSLLNGFYRRDARVFRQKFERLNAWHTQALIRDADLRVLAEKVLAHSSERGTGKLLFMPGYVEFLSKRPDYNPEELLGPEEMPVWQDLLARVRCFDLLSAFRNLILPVRWEGGQLTFRAGGLDRTWVGERHLVLSATTRPIDFFASTVIDPVVQRFGLIYDISQFSERISVLNRSGSDTQEQAFRQMFFFQRRISRLAASFRLQLEKYLGDGAFYTHRQALPILLCAIHLQRLYKSALDQGLPFDKGMRLALNFGQYRLIPIQAGATGETERYEFFGHGVVELTRLTSGKASLEIDEIKTTLISYGYPPQAVLRFFEPLEGRNLDLVDREEQARRFYAYINRNGSLINEGIVATQGYIQRLSEALGTLEQSRVQRGRNQAYLAAQIPYPEGGSGLVGFRRLGIARLKGLDNTTLFEIVDGRELETGALEPLVSAPLLEGLGRVFATTVEGGPPLARSTNA